MRTILVLLALLTSPLRAQNSAPRFLFIYRDSLKLGTDSAYRVIENDGAQICADLRCPNPYLALESLSGPHEVWWINEFATAADTSRVARAYATNRAISDALAVVAQRKSTMIGTPVQGLAVNRGDLSSGPAWNAAAARFVVVTITRAHRKAEGSVWAMADSTLYILRTARTRAEATTLAGRGDARIFAVRPNWSMPAREWVAADPGFWRDAPSPRKRP